MQQNKFQNFKTKQQSNLNQNTTQNFNEQQSGDGRRTESVDALCSIPLFVQNVQFNALLDTGSIISTINSETWKKIQTSKNKLKQSELSFITGAGGTAHQVDGKIELHIKIGGLKLSQTFHVIQDLCHLLIWGTDFMKQQN